MLSSLAGETTAGVPVDEAVKQAVAVVKGGKAA